MTDLLARVTETFTADFGETAPGDPAILRVRAPGRVNLIGEHTDYNDGFVLPMAIDRAVIIALRPRPDRIVRIHALDFNETAEFDLDTMPPKSPHAWIEYAKGVAWSLGEAGYALGGWEGVLAGDVPIGAGLSSSAAMETAVARAFCAVGGWAWDAPHMAQACQRAENEWIGVKSGIMDQMISAAGVAGRALLIDCRWLIFDPAPLPSGTVAVIMDTMTRRELVTSAYNERREQCETAARFFHVPALRDVTMTQFYAAADLLDPLVARRARHIISENARTLAAAGAMRAGDPVEMGRLMDESHASMRDDFEITNDALNTMVTIARPQPGCYGARMTGGGFGGCAVALVDAAQAESFTAAVSAAYHAQTGFAPNLYVSVATDGAGLV